MYNFAYTHHADGTPTHSFAVLEFLKEHGPATKNEIYLAVWGCYPSSKGCNSKFFTRLNCSNLAYYNPHDHKWHIGHYPYDGSTMLDWHYRNTSYYVICEGDKYGYGLTHEYSSSRKKSPFHY